MSDDEDPFDIDHVEGSDDEVPSPVSLVAPLEDEHEANQEGEAEAADEEEGPALDDPDEDDDVDESDLDFLDDDDDDDDDAGDEGKVDDGIEASDDDEVIENDLFGIPRKVKRPKTKKSRQTKKSEFIDDEAELSGDDDVSADELDSSDDDEKVDTTIVDLEAKDLGSDEEEEIRRLYHKQLETEDRRQLLMLQEQLEENDITAGHRRRKKFRWQTKELMENSLRRHYDPDDEDSQEGDDDDFDYSELNQPRLRRPNAESLLIGSTSIMPSSDKGLLDSDESDIEIPRSYPRSGRISGEPRAGTSYAMSDDSNSNLVSRASHPAIRPVAANAASADLNRFLFRDKDLVEALSTKEVVITTREEKERVIQREIKRVLQSKSIFDQLYS